ncbi:YidH family protein [Aspergillus undulatus]|uniref:YidH family protein n=1 Tax=Aspergillus undulatus TaxID=1810928 RepID=UPI003CCD94C0
MAPFVFLRRLFPKPIANNGSQLRDHQANERTFLSWTRMGLAFAAMGLAVGRLGLIEQFFNSTSTSGSSSKLVCREEKKKKENESRTGLKTSPDLVASRLCQVISVWSFGYGLFRYLSVRRNLGKGQFVPAVWGPVLMTAGTLGVVGVLVRGDWKKPRGGSEERQEGQGLLQMVLGRAN